MKTAWNFAHNFAQFVRWQNWKFSVLMYGGEWYKINKCHVLQVVLQPQTEVWRSCTCAEALLSVGIALHFSLIRCSLSWTKMRFCLFPSPLSLNRWAHDRMTGTISTTSQSFPYRDKALPLRLRMPFYDTLTFPNQDCNRALPSHWREICSLPCLWVIT